MHEKNEKMGAQNTGSRELLFTHAGSGPGRAWPGRPAKDGWLRREGQGGGTGGTDPVESGRSTPVREVPGNSNCQNRNS